MMEKDNYVIQRPHNFNRNFGGGGNHEIYGSFVSTMTQTYPPHKILTWEMEHVALKLKCPYCSGYARLVTDMKSIMGEQSILACYRCEKCGDFTTTEIDEMNMRPHFAKKQKIRNLIEIIKDILQ
jgi:hypothetical protein